MELRLVIEDTEPPRGTVGPLNFADYHPLGLVASADVPFEGWLGLMQAIATLVGSGSGVPCARTNRMDCWPKA